MMKIKELASKMEYPGRFIIMGNHQESLFAVYGVTARSAPSKAKRYILSPDKKSICVEATDIDVMSKGDLSLLDYTAVHFFDNGIVIGNGQQTSLVKDLNSSAKDVLSKNLKDETYELDKYHTPRITGAIIKHDSMWSEGLHIIRDKNSSNPSRESFDISVYNKGAMFISTYAGQNIRPTPSFQDKPIEIEPLTGTTQEIAEHVYNAFAPEQDNEDLRVSVIVVLMKENTGKFEHYIINNVDLS